MFTDSQILEYFKYNFEFSTLEVAELNMYLNDFKDDAFDYDFGDIDFDKNKMLSVVVKHTPTGEVLELKHDSFETFLKEFQDAFISADLPKENDTIKDILQTFKQEDISEVSEQEA